MTSFRYLLTPVLVAGGLLLAFAGTSHAQYANEPGIVRVSDGRITSSQLPALPAMNNISRVNQTVEQGVPADAQTINGHCPQCQYGYCPDGACQYGCHHSQCCHHIHAFLDWFNPHGACTHSPDHGYAPPIKSPVYRRGVAYTKYFPDAWMGMPSADMSGATRAPLVYMPTDTTQLGYYYQQVPQWLPNRAMVPPAPNPKLHHYTCHDKANCRICQNGVVYGQSVEVVNPAPQGMNGVIPPAPQGVPGNVIEAQPDAAPIESAAPAPLPEAVPGTPAPGGTVEKINF